MYIVLMKRKLVFEKPDYVYAPYIPMYEDMSAMPWHYKIRKLVWWKQTINDLWFKLRRSSREKGIISRYGQAIDESRYKKIQINGRELTSEELEELMKQETDHIVKKTISSNFRNQN